MSRGTILFAFNSPDYDYVKMAEFAARQVNHFLKLPCTLITDNRSAVGASTKLFDQIITIDSDSDNQFIDGRMWLNKGRYQAYDLSPYDETLLLDVDYVVNSAKLNLVFDIMDDFICHDSISYLTMEHNKKEYLSQGLSLPTLWATVILFKKTRRAKQIFDCLKMVQENYDHYANIHKFPTETYRNDYGLTLAYRIANGHLNNPKDFIPWSLTHVHPKTRLLKNSTNNFDTSFTLLIDKWTNNKIKKEYMVIKDIDFHVIDKKNFLEITQSE